MGASRLRPSIDLARGAGRAGYDARHFHRASSSHSLFSLFVYGPTTSIHLIRPASDPRDMSSVALQPFPAFPLYSLQSFPAYLRNVVQNPSLTSVYLRAQPIHSALLFCIWNIIWTWLMGELTGNVSQVDRCAQLPAPGARYRSGELEENPSFSLGESHS